MKKINDVNMDKEFEQIVQEDIDLLRKFLDTPQEVELNEKEYSAIMRLACCGMTFVEAVLVLAKNPGAIVRGQDAPWCLVNFEALQNAIAIKDNSKEDSLLYMPDGLNKIVH